MGPPLAFCFVLITPLDRNTGNGRKARRPNVKKIEMRYQTIK